MEKLKTAIDYGADAVYGSINHFSLRQRGAKGFDKESFSEGIKYAHDRGKKVFVTINGFPFNNQIERLKKHLEEMASLEPDAFIVATPGVLKLSQEIAPQINKHLSTQANVLNYLDAEIYHNMGATRIVTAREISLKDIQEIKKHLPNLEIEVFVHGSMCFAYSGRCLISSLQTGRTPNRGSCANDCRFPYDVYLENRESGISFRLEEEEGVGTYVFNSKDLNLASYIDQLIEANCIDALKIEGRTKSIYYAGVTAKTYKMAIEDYKNKKYQADKYQEILSTTKNRGFTDAYLISRPFEKRNTQNHKSAMSKSINCEVSGIVCEDETYFMCKYKIYPNDEIELFTPLGVEIECVDNDIGTIYQKDGSYMMKLKQIKTQNGKILESVHSGNTNPILLPAKVQRNVFLRKFVTS